MEIPLNSRWGKGGGVFGYYQKSPKLKNIILFLAHNVIKKFCTFVCDFWVNVKLDQIVVTTPEGIFARDIEGIYEG